MNEEPTYEAEDKNAASTDDAILAVPPPIAPPPVASSHDELRTQVSDLGLRAARTEGRMVTLKEAVIYLLELQRRAGFRGAIELLERLERLESET